ncbi:MAG: DJ-1/PfpI family protein [Acidobacteria bacterium]|nr:MAG: DJ-1/PfpI family protein [Acidobacteriota bacterium]REK06399.1 MAG: DJ-1/PfpI family protein [Acidobacteriota bacterium]
MKIAFLLYPGFTALDIVGPFDVLCRLPGADATFVGKQATAYPNDNQRLTMVAAKALAEVPDPDVVVVPGGTEGTRAAARDPEILDWLRAAHEHTRWTTSVCTGSLILAGAGLLEGAPATTHWAAAGELEKLGASYRPERWVRSGRLVTAAGVSAGIDMALWLAAQIAGDLGAQAIQLGIEYDPAPPFDSGSLAKASPEVRELVASVFG